MRFATQPLPSKQSRCQTHLAATLSFKSLYISSSAPPCVNRKKLTTHVVENALFVQSQGILRNSIHISKIDSPKTPVLYPSDRDEDQEICSESIKTVGPIKEPDKLNATNINGQDISINDTFQSRPSCISLIKSEANSVSTDIIDETPPPAVSQDNAKCPPSDQISFLPLAYDRDEDNFKTIETNGNASSSREYQGEDFKEPNCPLTDIKLSQDLFDTNDGLVDQIFSKTEENSGRAFNVTNNPHPDTQILLDSNECSSISGEVKSHHNDNDMQLSPLLQISKTPGITVDILKSVPSYILPSQGILRNSIHISKIDSPKTPVLYPSSTNDVSKCCRRIDFDVQLTEPFDVKLDCIKELKTSLYDADAQDKEIQLTTADKSLQEDENSQDLNETSQKSDDHLKEDEVFYEMDENRQELDEYLPGDEKLQQIEYMQELNEHLEKEVLKESNECVQEINKHIMPELFQKSDEYYDVHVQESEEYIQEKKEPSHKCEEYSQNLETTLIEKEDIKHYALQKMNENLDVKKGFVKLGEHIQRNGDSSISTPNVITFSPLTDVEDKDSVPGDEIVGAFHVSQGNNGCLTREDSNDVSHAQHCNKIDESILGCIPGEMKNTFSIIAQHSNFQNVENSIINTSDQPKNDEDLAGNLMTFRNIKDDSQLSGKECEAYEQGGTKLGHLERQCPSPEDEYLINPTLKLKLEDLQNKMRDKMNNSIILDDTCVHPLSNSFIDNKQCKIQYEANAKEIIHHKPLDFLNDVKLKSNLLDIKSQQSKTDQMNATPPEIIPDKFSPEKSHSDFGANALSFSPLRDVDQPNTCTAQIITKELDDCERKYDERSFAQEECVEQFNQIQADSSNESFAQVECVEQFNQIQDEACDSKEVFHIQEQESTVPTSPTKVTSHAQGCLRCRHSNPEQVVPNNGALLCKCDLDNSQSYVDDGDTSTSFQKDTLKSPQTNPPKVHTWTPLFTSMKQSENNINPNDDLYVPGQTTTMLSLAKESNGRRSIRVGLSKRQKVKHLHKYP